jgi:hypothetical protein
MAARYVATALEWLRVEMSEAEALEMWDATAPDLREGDVAARFTLWARSETYAFKLAPLFFERLDDAPAR